MGPALFTRKLSVEAEAWFCRIQQIVLKPPPGAQVCVPVEMLVEPATSSTSGEEPAAWFQMLAQSWV